MYLRSCDSGVMNRPLPAGRQWNVLRWFESPERWIWGRCCDRCAESMRYFDESRVMSAILLINVALDAVGREFSILPLEP